MNRDIRLGIVLMAIFILLFVLTFGFQSSGVMKTHTTAAFFPRVVLIIAMILTLLMIAADRIKGEKDEKTSTMPPETFKRVLISMGAAVCFGFGVSYIGALVSVALFIAGMMIGWGVKNRTTILLNAVITPVLIYLVFTLILEVQLPRGFLI